MQKNTGTGEPMKEHTDQVTIISLLYKAIKSRKSLKVKKELYEVTYLTGAVVYTPYLSHAMLFTGGVEFIAPQYCHPCRKAQSHFYFKIDDSVRCAACGNNLGENDDRPYAKVLQFPPKGGMENA
jgi:hypothetical protein